MGMWLGSLWENTMHRATQGILCVVGLWIFAMACGWRPLVQAQDPPFQRRTMPPAVNSSLITHTAESNTGQQLTVIDPRTRSMAVYHVEKNTGKVTLKSVRQIHWDLQLDEFNGVSPTPREIQTLLSR